MRQRHQSTMRHVRGPRCSTECGGNSLAGRTIRSGDVQGGEVHLLGGGGNIANESLTVRLTVMPADSQSRMKTADMSEVIVPILCR
jgi:hypothetical protein